MNISITSLAILVFVFQVTMAYEQCNASRPIFSCSTPGPDTRIYASRGSHLCVGGAKWCCPPKAFLHSASPSLKEALGDGCRPVGY
ncbi:hypothetical protein PGTUg99_035996 [Puccinia graminis f. sp. tritici]|uniref:Uncharacterized protein n=1 Tax=Puccinia graminis f. sp. tritici TaxID=56615 RepID=A0A5B0QW23_PUCGR|nr:hypothetical protein PGTUg99_035996 [Puccinia graminis f. sp. tritici]